MAIRKYHFYHGAVFSMIVKEAKFTAINRHHRINGNNYVINGDTGLHSKYSSEQAPWHFTFTGEHQVEIRRLFDMYRDKTYVALICGIDGVCLLRYGEYASVIDENFSEQEQITVERPPRGSFRVSGSRGVFPRRIRLSRFPDELFR